MNTQLDESTSKRPQASAAASAVVTSGKTPVKAKVIDFSFYYHAFQALKSVNMSFHANRVTVIIGPSGCGKSTLLRCFNRMHDLYPGSRYVGEITLYPSGRNVVCPSVDPVEMRIRNSMVFQKPNPFPKSIFENIAFGLRLRGESRSTIHGKVEASLRSAGLWDEVKDRLQKSAYALSGGQQQRLCIARALATDPEMLLLDEPTSALDPVATEVIENLITELRGKVTIAIVTHNMQQATRISDYTAFMYLGELVEFNATEAFFKQPAEERTRNYIFGRFG
jgi:phosphate transport system ATP-binding protein